MLLAIDTATSFAGLALYDPENLQYLGEETWRSANRHTVELMPRIVRLMDQQGISSTDLTGVAVSLGPGSFTGLRIGLGVAKGLALACRLPLVGIPTLRVIAEPHMTQRLPICAILQAGRGRICAGHYLRRKGRWRRKGEYRLTTLAELCEEFEGQALFCGELEASDIALLLDRLGPAIKIATPAASLRRAAFLAELGWHRLSRGDSDNAATLSPIYLHKP
jgi:tRNA threonylcarbamoyladenosine biosynthesis protein TsaB